jgi:C-methyltransferase
VSLIEIILAAFFEKVPADGDIYLLNHVIHDWPDEEAVAILRNVREADGPDARVLLVETVIPDHDRDFIGKWADLEMLLGGNGVSAMPMSIESCCT